jgi:hypothetical protein
MKLLDWCVAAPSLWRIFDDAALSLAQELGEDAVAHVRTLVWDDAPFMEKMQNRWFAARVRTHVQRLRRSENSRDGRKPGITW